MWTAFLVIVRIVQQDLMDLLQRKQAVRYASKDLMDLLQGKQAVRNAQQDTTDLLQVKRAVRYVLPILITLSPEEVNVLHALKGGMQHQVPLNVASTAPQHPRNPDTVMVVHELPIT